MKRSSTLYLCFFSAFLILGNVPRILSLPSSFGSANLGELLLYFSAFVYLFFCICLGRLSRNTKFGYAFILATLASLLIGLAKWGAQALAIIYNLRLVMQLLSAVAAGIAAANIYGDNASKLSKHLVRVYVIISSLALFLFILFPKSTALWAALGNAGIDFEGDPHVGRLVSFYFDPNYFGTIIVLPILLSFVPARSRFEMILSAGLFVFCLALTASRSGISTFALAMISMAGYFILKVRMTGRIKRSFLRQALIVIVISLTALLASSDYLTSIFARFTAISSDASAGSRYESFSIGNRLIVEEPFLGFGYNYGFAASKQYRDLSLDSSLQALIVNFGIIGTGVLVVLTIYWANSRSCSLRLSSTPTELRNLWHFVFFYFVLCMLWAGNFNQLIFYPFWIIPIVAIFSYVEIRSSV